MLGKKTNNIFSQIGGLIVTYHGTKWKNNTLNPGKWRVSIPIPMLDLLVNITNPNVAKNKNYMLDPLCLAAAYPNLGSSWAMMNKGQ